MPGTATSVFFYGLFMDMEALKEKGLEVSDPQMVEVKGFRLQIGKRASMIPSARDSVWGVLTIIPQEDLDKLYSDQSVADYQPEPMTAWLSDGTQVATRSYILSTGNDESPNREYASRLANLATRLNLPRHYVKTVEGFAG